MRLNLVPQRLVQLARRQRPSVSGCALALCLGLSSSCDDGIGRPIEAGASHAGASARSTTVAVGARASTAIASGGSGATLTTANGGTGPALTIVVSSTTVLVGGSASGGRSNQFTLLSVGGVDGLGGVRGTRTAVSECNLQEPWPEQWATNEDLLATLIILYRMAGLECGKESSSGSAMAVLDVDDPLRCFARQRSVSRSRNELPATGTGFESAVVVERETDVDATGADLFVDLWYGTDLTDCNILMREDFETLEVGYVALSGRAYWTIALR
ncbi:MAG TPA: hypothetical protein VKP30_16710 [Polyangiaceae bacterium]|nr:hypothetical protein [Polyangiaceae bacterium]